MGNLKALIRLVRWPNLVLLLMTQGLIWWVLVAPLNGFLTLGHFLILSFSTVLIAAGGYLINDLYDLEIDAVNKPGKVIIGRYISFKTGYRWYLSFTLLGIIMGFYLSFRLANFLPGLIPMTSALLLWLYAAYFKKSLLVGNLLIALLTALSILMLPAFEPALSFSVDLGHIDDRQSFPIWGILLFYTLFAFWLTLLRELIKDMEDVEGDRSAGAHTFPIVYGLKGALQLARFIVLFVFVLLMLSLSFFLQLGLLLLTAYLFCFLMVPLIYFALQLWKEPHLHRLHFLSNWLKGMMFLGLLALLVFRYIPC